MQKKVMLAAMALTLSLSASVSQASPIFAGFPPPGLVTFSASGSPTLTDSPGRMRSYSVFTSAGFWDALYFNIETGSLGGSNSNTVAFNDDFIADGGFGVSSQNLVGNNLGIDLSTGWSFFDFATNSFTAPVPVHLSLDFYRADGTTPLAFSDFSITSSGDGLPVWVLNITPATLAGWGGGFRVNQLYTVNGGTDASDWFAANNGSPGTLNASTVGAFWYDEPASTEAPEPGTLILFGTGFLLAARRMRRAEKQKQS